MSSPSVWSWERIDRQQDDADRSGKWHKYASWPNPNGEVNVDNDDWLIA